MVSSLVDASDTERIFAIQCSDVAKKTARGSRLLLAMKVSRLLLEAPIFGALIITINPVSVNEHTCAN